MKKQLLVVCILFFQFTVKGQFFLKFENGYFIDSNGNNNHGLIKYVYGNHSFLFKKNDKDKKRKVDIDECKGLVLDSAKFVKAGGFSVRIGVGDFQITNDFIEILEEGKINLYKHYGKGSSGNGTPWIYENLVVKRNNENYIGLHPNIRKRRKQLEKIFVNDIELIEILCKKDEIEIIGLLKQNNLVSQGSIK